MPSQLQPLTTNPAFTSRCIQRDDWPHRDRALYDAGLKSLFRPPNAKKRLAELSPRTRETDEYGYGTWVNFLVQHGALDPDVDPEARIDENRVDLYVGALEAAGVASKSIAMYLSGTYRTLRAMHSKGDWTWLCEMVECARANAAAVVTKHGLPSIAQLLKYGMELVNAAESLPTERERALAYRDGLLIVLLADRSLLRRRNLHMLAFGVHVVRRPSGYELVLAASERKAYHATTAPLSKILTPILDRYRDIHHPFLVKRYGLPVNERRLWVSQSGDILLPAQLTLFVGRLTKKKFGRRVTPHMFRNATANSYYQTAPEQIADLPIALDHANLAMSEKYVWLADQNIAVEKLDKAVSKIEKG